MIPSAILTELKNTVAKFLTRFRLKYKSPKVSRKLDRIFADQWSISDLKFPDTFISFLDQKTKPILKPGNKENEARREPESEKPKGLVGRKRKSFEEKKSRSQLKESSDIRGKYSPGVIHLASKQNLKIEVKKDAAFVVKRISSETGRTAKFARDAILGRNNLSDKPVTKKTPEEALFFLLTNNLTLT